MRTLVSTLALAVGLACASLPAAAMTYQMMADSDLLDQADGVAVFEVAQVAASAPGDTETRYLLRFDHGLAGTSTFAYEWLALPGSDDPDSWREVDGVPKLAPGERWLLFFHRRVDGVLQPQQLTLGMFKRIDDSAGGSYWRTVDVDHAGAAKSLHDVYAAPRDTAGFEQWLRAAGQGASAAPDYLLSADDPRFSAKYTISMFGFSTPKPGRWFEFDAGGTVPVYAAAGGQANTSYDEFASLRSAISAWDNDPGSRIGLAWAGTGQSGADSAVNVSWNDPAGDIAGSFDCSRGGVLAIGGSSATSAQMLSLNGYTWAKRVRGFVTVQDGAGCSMDRHAGADGAELLTHELGHVLALGHSCGDSSSGSCSTTAKNEAVMRANIHGDGRGAQLGSDDRAGIAVPYPQPAGSGGGSTTALVMRDGFER